MVKIIGAGPGAKDLITVRGMRALQEADVIIYAGSLVNEELLEYAKKECEIYNSAYMNLDEVIDVIVKAEQVGYRLLSVMFFTAGAMPRFSLTAVKQLRKKLTVFRLPAVRRL